MDQAILVIYRLGDGQKLIERLVRNRFEIMAAFWLYTNDNDKWRLMLVSRTVDTEGPRASYGAVQRAFDELPDLQMDRTFDVTVLSPRKPLARGVLEYLKRDPSKGPKRVEQTLLGRVCVESVYIYPPELYLLPEPAAQEG